MSGQDDRLSGQTVSGPVILTGQVHAFQINNRTNKFIHIISVHYQTVKSGAPNDNFFGRRFEI